MVGGTLNTLPSCAHALTLPYPHVCIQITGWDAVQTCPTCHPHPPPPPPPPVNYLPGSGITCIPLPLPQHLLGGCHLMLGRETGAGLDARWWEQNGCLPACLVVPTPQPRTHCPTCLAGGVLLDIQNRNRPALFCLTYLGRNKVVITQHLPASACLPTIVFVGAWEHTHCPGGACLPSFPEVPVALPQLGAGYLPAAGEGLGGLPPAVWLDPACLPSHALCLPCTDPSTAAQPWSWLIYPTCPGATQATPTTFCLSYYFLGTVQWRRFHDWW